MCVDTKTIGIFLQHIFKHDIILLAETHVGYGEAVNIPGYHYFPICRDQSNNGRYFGGYLIFAFFAMMLNARKKFK
jgi:hypothetical protein